ncbi:MAG: Multi antimicrobial extrusion protein (Na(+)/drug antiporter), MATE family of MDR efflux pumps, partial [uncultured Gemmatimonadaceae bacterium]
GRHHGPSARGARRGDPAARRAAFRLAPAHHPPGGSSGRRVEPSHDAVRLGRRALGGDARGGRGAGRGVHLAVLDLDARVGRGDGERGTHGRGGAAPRRGAPGGGRARGGGSDRVRRGVRRAPRRRGNGVAGRALGGDGHAGRGVGAGGPVPGHLPARHAAHLRLLRRGRGVPRVGRHAHPARPARVVGGGDARSRPPLHRRGGPHSATRRARGGRGHPAHPRHGVPGGRAHPGAARARALRPRPAGIAGQHLAHRAARRAHRRPLLRGVRGHHADHRGLRHAGARGVRRGPPRGELALHGRRGVRRRGRGDRGAEHRRRRPGARRACGVDHHRLCDAAGAGLRAPLTPGARDAGRPLHQRPGGDRRRGALPPHRQPGPARGVRGGGARGVAGRGGGHAPGDAHLHRPHRRAHPARRVGRRPLRARRPLVDDHAHGVRARGGDRAALAQRALEGAAGV